MKMYTWNPNEGFKSSNNMFYFLKGFFNSPFLSINNGNKKINLIQYVEIVYEVVYDDYLYLYETSDNKHKIEFLISFNKNKHLNKHIEE